MGIGGENVNANASGAYTGEIAANMLVDAGCKYVIIGHSERRAMGETDADVNDKVLAALEAGLIPIVCCGESLEQRETGITEEWITMQIKSALRNVPEEKIRKVIIAYEPIWAIGTGRTATPSRLRRSVRASAPSSGSCTAPKTPGHLHPVWWLHE